MTRHDRVDIRAETAADHAAISQVTRLAFGRDDEARLVDALRASSAFIPALSLVAEIGQRIVGHILFTAIHIQAPGAAIAALALAPLAVQPAHQRQGIGSQLVRAGLDRARELDHAIVIVLGHPEYYPRFGFSSARARGVNPPFPTRDEAFMVLELQPHALDGVSGVVEYSAPFAAV